MSRLNPDGLGGMPPLDPKAPSIRSAFLLRQGLESFDQVLQRTRQASGAASNPPTAARRPIEEGSPTITALGPISGLDSYDSIASRLG